MAAMSQVWPQMGSMSHSWLSLMMLKMLSPSYQAEINVNMVNNWADCRHLAGIHLPWRLAKAGASRKKWTLEKQSLSSPGDFAKANHKFLFYFILLYLSTAQFSLSLRRPWVLIYLKCVIKSQLCILYWTRSFCGAGKLTFPSCNLCPCPRKRLVLHRPHHPTRKDPLW